MSQVLQDTKDNKHKSEISDELKYFSCSCSCSHECSSYIHSSAPYSYWKSTIAKSNFTKTHPRQIGCLNETQMRTQLGLLRCRKNRAMTFFLGWFCRKHINTLCKQLAALHVDSIFKPLVRNNHAFISRNCALQIRTYAISIHSLHDPSGEGIKKINK